MLTHIEYRNLQFLSALTQCRSLRDWVCGGPPCHQLKPREETMSVTFPTDFSRACLACSAPSSEPETHRLMLDWKRSFQVRMSKGFIHFKNNQSRPMLHYSHVREKPEMSTSPTRRGAKCILIKTSWTEVRHFHKEERRKAD